MAVKNEYIDFVKNRLDWGKFKVFVRYMVRVAESKRCVTYRELEQVFGLGRDYMGWFAGILGFYCCYHQWPMLNALIINSTDCVPSEGFIEFQAYANKPWGELVSECWRRFHVPYSADNKDHYSGSDDEVEEFLQNFSTYFDEQKIYSS